MNQQEFDRKFNRLAPPPPAHSKVKLKRKTKDFCLGDGFFTQLCGFFPILHWLPKYKWKENFSGDLVGGLTVGIVQVPQGMAYASLASLDPVYGLYSSFFAGVIYMFFGTSRHISIGVFAVASLMVGSVRLRLIPDPTDEELLDAANGDNNVSVYDLAYDASVTPIVLTTSLTLAVGIVQLAMGVLRLGFMTAYMSDQLLAGFTTGAACHVLVAQLNRVFGIKLPRHSGLFMLFYVISVDKISFQNFDLTFSMVHDLTCALYEANYVTVLVSLFAMAFLVVGKDVINPWVKKRFPVPIPFELLLVIFGTAISHGAGLEENFNVTVVDHIPTGIPSPSLPRFDLVPDLMTDAIGIAVVCFVVSVSMGKLFAKKHRYRLDAGQELYALGAMECLSSFFPVFPSGTALSRSLVSEAAGTKTQLSLAFSSLLLLLIIVFLGPLLHALPMCILASIVIVALQGFFKQFKQLKKLWVMSKFDFYIWIVSFFATTCYDVIQGLTVSVAFVLFTVVFRSQWPKWQRLGRVSDDVDEYRDVCRYGTAEELAGIRIFRFYAPLNFANVELFKKTLMVKVIGSKSLTGSSKKPLQKPPIVESLITMKRDTSGANVQTLLNGHCQLNLEKADTQSPLVKKVSKKVQVVILDCAPFAYVDAMGVEALQEIYFDLKARKIRLYFAAVNDDVRDMLKAINFYQLVPSNFFYPSIQSVVAALQPQRIADSQMLAAQMPIRLSQEERRKNSEESRDRDANFVIEGAPDIDTSAIP